TDPHPHLERSRLGDGNVGGDERRARDRSLRREEHASHQARLCHRVRPPHPLAAPPLRGVGLRLHGSLPARIQEDGMPELTRRYIVMTMATEGPFDMGDPDAPFVLKPWKDPAALRALEVYREHCYPELAEELAAWIDKISSGPVIRGGVGGRNERHLATKLARRAKSTVRATSSRPRAKTKVAERQVRRRKRKRSR